MTGLPNLARLIEQATPGPWRTSLSPHEEGFVVSMGEPTEPTVAWTDGRRWLNYSNDAALIAAAPVLAELLIECEQALVFAQEHAKRSWWANARAENGEPLGDYPPERFNEGQARLSAALARLADYDEELGAAASP